MSKGMSPFVRACGLTVTAVLAGMLLVACGGPAEPEVAEYTIEDFLRTTATFGQSFSPDKSKILVSSDATGVLNAYAVSVADGTMEQLTDSEVESVRAVSYFPTDERFLYMSDQGGDELDHLYVREADGSVTDLTPGEGHKARFGGWAADDASFFVASSERDNRYFDIYEYDIESYEREMIYQDDSGLPVGAISPDKRYFALSETITTADSNVYLYDRQTEEKIALTPHEGQVSNDPGGFSRDGESFFYTTDEGSEFSYLVRYDLATREREKLIEADWDVLTNYFSRDGEYMVVMINNDAANEIRLYDYATMERVALPELPGLDIGPVSFSRDSELMSFYASSSRRPSDLYVHDLGGEGEPRRLTDSLNPNIDPEHLVDAEVVRFASYDGVEIPGILYRPHGATADAKVPALVWVHGGPGGQSRVGYSPLMQYLVNHGYAVYAINNRGSSGYGKTFYKMDDRKHGEADLGDVVASKGMLIDTGWVDPEQIGIIGGSYGGYMVLAALAFEPQEFNVGVDIFGVSNWVRTLKSVPPWWESFRQALYEELGDPEQEEERLRRISPLFHASNIERPLMVLQGANDPRVLKVESDEIVAAVEANGVPVEYLVFDDEGHGFRKKENQERGYRAIREFLDVYLKGEAPANDGGGEESPDEGAEGAEEAAEAA